MLIWNTIRTAMFARRREIEVMKLVGATDWFIRLPFMLEGLIQGFIGGLAACGGLWLINDRWTAGVSDFPPKSGFAQLVVSDGFLDRADVDPARHRHVAGAIGADIAASRFLDVYRFARRGTPAAGSPGTDVLMYGWLVLLLVVHLVLSSSRGAVHGAAKSPPRTRFVPAKVSARPDQRQAVADREQVNSLNARPSAATCR